MVELTLGFPNEIENGTATGNGSGIYASEIMDENRGPIAVQSSRVFWDRANSVQLDNAHNRKGIEAFYDKIKDIESSVCEQISKNSESWFGTSLDYETILNSLFNTALKVPSRFNEPFSMYTEFNSKNIAIYDAKKRPRTVDDVVGEVTVLLHAKRVVLSSMSAHIEWEILQVLIHKKKSVIKLSELTIREEVEEHVPVELFSKKTKKKVEKTVNKEPVVEPIVEEDEPEELVVEEVVRPDVEDVVVNKEPEIIENSEDVEEVGELEPTPAKFVLEE